VLLAWGALLVASAELVSAVGRLPNQTDLHYLFDPQFMENSTGGALAHPGCPGCWPVPCWCCWPAAGTAGASAARPAAHCLGMPVLLLTAHWGSQQLFPSDADQWRQYNLPHQLLSAATGDLQHRAGTGRRRNPVTPLPGLTQADLNGQKLLAGPGSARNLLVITLEGIPGAYMRANREAIGSHFTKT
jgi:hypothetical protein